MRYPLHWQGAMELPDLTVQKSSVKLLMKRWESASALTPSLAFQRLPAPRSLAPEKASPGSTVEDAAADSGRADVTLGGPRRTETFPISVKELQSHFETLGGRKEAESGRSSLPPALATQPGSQTDISLMEVSSVKRGRAIFEKMSSGNGQTTNTEVGGCKAVGGLPEDSPPNTGNTLTEFQENVSLKDKMALYQAAVSKAENSNRFANTSEEIKSCTVPGGLAAVRKHFENGQMTPSMTTFAHSQHQHKAAEETSSTTQLPLSSSTREAECSATSSKEAPLEAFQSKEVSLGEQVTPETNGASTLTRHTDEAGKKWLESNGSQRSTTNQVLGNRLYWHKRGAAFRIQIQDIAPSCSVPPSSAKHIHWSQWDLRNRFPCWYTERSLAEGGSFKFVLSCWKERGILRDV
ncbi:uncharacterized protein [Anser cygnoides]|uniref:uncharacterized protein isoform X2 n=1 Tax=Anser cygnoides TaxID=8845 RepID=UPI0034D191AC